MDIIAYTLAKKYTEETADSLGSLRGAPCTIESITAIENGNRIIFKWTGTSGATQTATLDVMNGTDGTDGTDGKSVDSIVLNNDNSLTVIFSDGTSTTTNPINTVKGDKGDKGDTGDNGTDGVSPEITVKTSTENAYILHIKTADDEFDTPNLKGSGSDGGASSVSELTDVNLDALTNGQILVYNSATHKWENGDQSADIESLGDIADVDLTNLKNGQQIVWDSTAQKWKNADVLNPTQFSTMPAPEDYPQQIVQFTGTTTPNYTQGYFYRSTPKVVSGELSYSWEQIDVEPSSRNYNDLENKPEINGISVIGSKTSSELGLQGQIQFSVAPTADNTNAGKVIQWIGNTTADFKNGYFYQCRYDSDTTSYKWVQVDVSSNAALESAVQTLQTNQGDMSQLAIGGVSDLVSALNALNSKELQSITYVEPNVVVTWKSGEVYRFNIQAILNDTEIGELSNVIDTTIANGNILQYDSAILKYKPYDILSALAQLLQEAKDYTDNEITSSVQAAALVCDEKPSYDAVNDTVVYKQNGEIKTTTHTDTRFYYEDGEGNPYCSSWIDDIEFTYSVSDSKFSDYVNKNTDTVNTYTESLVDKKKVPTVAALDALLLLIKTSLAEKVNTADIVDSLISQDATKVLSAKQGKVLDDKLAAKNDKFQYGTMPTASSTYAGIVVQYIGTSSALYKKGSFYACLYDSVNDVWEWKSTGSYTKEEIDEKLSKMIELVSNE